MGWNPFKRDKEENSLEDNSLEKKLDGALSKAREERRDAENEIKKIESWAAEAIVDTYADQFPNGHLTYYREQYKEKALSTYKEIKTENAEKIPADKAAKCDEIVSGYMNQIELRKSKIKLYDKMIKEYEATKSGFKNIERKKASGNKLSKHQERLSELDSNTDIYTDALTDSDKMKELQREFEMKEEYMRQLDELSRKYSADAPDKFDSSGAFKDELDKIIKDLD